MNRNTEVITLHPFLQRIARTSLALIVFTFLSFVAVFIYKALLKESVIHLLLMMLVGLIIWTLIEYLVHRFIFHGRSTNRKVQKFRFFMHGYHHQYPTDKNRLVLPIVITLPIILLIFVIISRLGVGFGLLAGMTLGYVLYDGTHYMIHRSNPKNKILLYLKRYHFYHHFKNSECCFGVTSPFWDYPFKTRP